VNKFPIYIKSYKFFWSNNKIILVIFLISLSISLFNKTYIHYKENIINDVFVAIIMICLLAGTAAKLNSKHPLNGKLIGFVIFKLKSIQIGKEIFEIENIEKIEISNKDYYKKHPSSNGGNFNSMFSNGIDNTIKLYFISGKQLIFNFQQNTKNELITEKEKLISYTLNGKLHFLNLIDILGIYKYEEIQEFKKQIGIQ
jgi:hypothetical protein